MATTTGLFSLCDKLGLDYDVDNVVTTGDVYVSKYDPGDAEVRACRDVQCFNMEGSR